jgi:transposase
VHGLRDFAFDVVCLDARHARAALKMQINKKMTLKDWLKSFVWSVHVKWFDSHRARVRFSAQGRNWSA